MRRFVAGCALLVLSAPAAAAGPGTLAHQGRLLDAAGAPLDGTHDITLSLHDAPAGGAALYTETLGVDFDNGFYSVTLGASGGLGADTFTGGAAWLELSVDDGAPLPVRLALNSVPWAFVADTATNVSGGVVDATEIRIDGATVMGGGVELTTLSSLGCGDGDVPQFDGAAWGCTPWSGAHTHSAVDIDDGVLDIARLPMGTGPGDVAAGDHGHPANDIVSGTFDVARLPVGSGSGEVAAGDHSHPASGVDALSCDAGQVAKVDGSGAWACGDDDDTDTNLSEADVENFVTNEAIDLAAGSSVGGDALATQDDIDALGTSQVCTNYMKQASARTGDTLWSQLDADYTGAGVCGSGWHVCNFQEYTVYAIMGACSVNSSWILGGFSNTDAHRRSIWNGQDSTQCAAGNGLQTYGKWGPYDGRVHCTSRAGSAPVLCCKNR